MRYLDLTLPTPAENLALDEALLEAAEQSGDPGETLRVWEPDEPMVVVGRSSRVAKRCGWRMPPPRRTGLSARPAAARPWSPGRDA